MIRTIVELAIMAACTLLFAVILVEWAAGCGETYTDARGETHAYQCVLIPNRED